MQTPSTPPPAAGSNTLTLDALKAKATELGEQFGKGKDTQIKFLLTTLEGGYHNAVDLAPNKHGVGRDDASILAEAYVKARGTATVFDAKSDNQQKLISTLRTAIKLGQWPKGGQGEPLATVNALMTERQKLRRDPNVAKKLDDAANAFLKYARTQMKRDTLIDPKEFNDFLFKKVKDPATATEHVESLRNSLKKLIDGAASGGMAQDNSKLVRDAHKALTDRLAEIARAKGASQPGGSAP